MKQNIYLWRLERDTLETKHEKSQPLSYLGFYTESNSLLSAVRKAKRIVGWTNLRCKRVHTYEGVAELILPSRKEKLYVFPKTSYN